MLTQVTSDANASDHAGHEKFSEVIDNLRLQLPSDQPIDFAALRDCKTQPLGFLRLF